jgi:hypothetical protein
MRDCCTLKCARLATRDKRPVVWKVGPNYYCNCCFLNDLEAGRFEVTDSIIRLFEDEELYYDIRTIKRRKRVPQTTEGMMARAHA